MYGVNYLIRICIANTFDLNPNLFNAYENLSVLIISDKYINGVLHYLHCEVWWNVKPPDRKVAKSGTVERRILC